MSILYLREGIKTCQRVPASIHEPIYFEFAEKGMYEKRHWALRFTIYCRFFLMVDSSAQADMFIRQYVLEQFHPNSVKNITKMF